jgi:Ca2+-binding EF-hand superfamily protein
MTQENELTKSIRQVTVARLQMVLSGIGMNIDDKELDVILEAVELIEDKEGNVTVDDIITLKNNHYGNE